MDTIEIEKIGWDHYGLYVPIHLLTPDDMDKFLDTFILLSLGNEERENPKQVKNI